jgi:hypothetical protein
MSRPEWYDAAFWWLWYSFLAVLLLAVAAAFSFVGCERPACEDLGLRFFAVACVLPGMLSGAFCVVGQTFLNLRREGFAAAIMTLVAAAILTHRWLESQLFG